MIISNPWKQNYPQQLHLIHESYKQKIPYVIFFFKFISFRWRRLNICSSVLSARICSSIELSLLTSKLKVGILACSSLGSPMQSLKSNSSLTFFRWTPCLLQGLFIIVRIVTSCAHTWLGPSLVGFFLAVWPTHWCVSCNPLVHQRHFPICPLSKQSTPSNC